MIIRRDTQEVLADLDEQYGFTRLCQPIAGVVNSPMVSQARELADPDLQVASSIVGDLSALIPELRSWNGGRYGATRMSGGCADEDADTAIMKSVAEAVERYAMTVIRKGEYVVASAEELGDEALDWRRFPAGLDEEYERYQGVKRFDPRAKLRWVRGISLVDGRALFVPVSLTHITTNTRSAEAFTLPISTGVAVHSDLDEAVSRAILEVVERDSIALTWLLRLALPRIEFDRPPPAEWAARFDSFAGSHALQYLFDATTDLGIPVVYGVMTAPGHPTAATVVTAASDLDPFAACAKAMREAVSTRMAVVAFGECPKEADECYSLEHGAAFMGRPERASAFDFLLGGSGRRPISKMQGRPSLSSRESVAWLVDTLARHGCEPVAVDLTTDELSGNGLRAVRVVIPELMPMSYVHRNRFLAHPRLRNYARSIGIDEIATSSVNPLPQPFA